MERNSGGQTRGPLFYIGAGGLVLAMAVEALAVLGRHAGIPLLGAMEIIQASILLMASTAMLSATLNKGHATVTLLTTRVGERARGYLHAFANLMSALFFVGLATGVLWLAVEAWNDHEQSELLHIPFRPLRIVSLIAAVAIALVFLRDMGRSLRGRA
ncbi:TRAP transporter small permease [Steroidobacter flavus]|uniref:TRAP transporter small permease protein n=1 Tax=Steroidobacter flavus TaxID=1842136 RepID=A0ABV8T006_9GAMM